MCSIMGYCSRSAAFDVFMKDLRRPYQEVRNDTRVVETGDGLLGFQQIINSWD